jgi:hypothetical protein
MLILRVSYAVCHGRKWRMWKEDFSEYPDYVWLSYFRWICLIESSEYKDFYDKNQIAHLISKEDGLIKKSGHIHNSLEERGHNLYYKKRRAAAEAHELARIT